MIDVEAVTSVCDVFVIAHGNSSTQVRALADYVEKELKENEELLTINNVSIAKKPKRETTTPKPKVDIEEIKSKKEKSKSVG